MAKTSASDSPSASADPPAPPLQLGHWIYLVQDAAILTTPVDQHEPSELTTITFEGKAGQPASIVPSSSPLTLPNPTTLLDVVVVNNVASSRQEMMILRENTSSALTLDRMAWSDDTNAPALTTYDVPNISISSIIDYLPAQASTSQQGGAPAEPPLMLAGFEQANVFIYALDLASGDLSSWDVPVSSPAPVVGAFFIRCQTQAYIVIIGMAASTGGTSQLFAYGMPASVLKNKAIPGGDVTCIPLGAIGQGAEICATAAQTIPDTSDQQLFIAYAGAKWQRPARHTGLRHQR